MSALEKLTEGIVARDLGQEGAALLNKWEGTGLLEGLGNDTTKNNMARLLENQAKQLLKEASTMASGDVEGFSAVAFPIVRRVFGELIANELVSVQPMSLPSGLIFYMDFAFNSNRLGNGADTSLYGGGVTGSALQNGMTLDSDGAERGPYALNNGYSSPTGSGAVALTAVASGTFGGTGSTAELGGLTQEQFDNILCQSDPDFISGTTTVVVKKVAISDLDNLNKDNLISVAHGTAGNAAVTGSQRLVRRLTRFSGSAANNFIGGRDATHAYVVFAEIDGAVTATAMAAGKATLTLSWAVEDVFASTGNAAGAVRGAPSWGLEAESAIPEVDIKVESVAVTAKTKKLKAKWSPELGQDLNAYHNVDAEVELTSILSEQIALEIDQEILQDLIQGATAGKRYWSRRAGKFVNKTTGNEIGASGAPDFTGTVSEWYETLLETINDVSAEIHRKTVRGGANFIVCSPEVANILEFTAGFRANVSVDANGTSGAVNVGNISKKLDVYVDPYFPRNVILVGRRGNSFLESGYVYAPYVPLQVTPTIFGTEDFVPRKGVMTRYGKKMVRPDMYGLVICLDLTS